MRKTATVLVLALCLAAFAAPVLASGPSNDGASVIDWLITSVVEIVETAFSGEGDSADDDEDSGPAFIPVIDPNG